LSNISLTKYSKSESLENREFSVPKILDNLIKFSIDQNLNHKSFVFPSARINKDLRGVLKPLSIKIKVYKDFFLYV